MLGPFPAFFFAGVCPYSWQAAPVLSPIKFLPLLSLCGGFELQAQPVTLSSELSNQAQQEAGSKSHQS
jgi:hypothetical protein